MNTEKSEQALIKKIRGLVIVIAILIIAILSCVFYYFFSSAEVNKKPRAFESVKFIEGVFDDKAAVGIENFRNFVNNTSLEGCQGAVYDTADISKYLSTRFVEITKRHEANATQPPNTVWKLAFYWMVREDIVSKKNKAGFYVVPVLYDTTKKVVLDYFSHVYDRNYNHSYREGEENIYDEGQLWP